MNLPAKTLIPGADRAAFLDREWFLANGLGGYASGTLGGRVSRRYHGLLVAALPAPHGRTVMLNHLGETVRLPDDRRLALTTDEDETLAALAEVRFEGQLPTWRFVDGDTVLERRIFLVNGQNTVHVTYLLLAASGPVRLALRPALQFRPHEDDVASGGRDYALRVSDRDFEVQGRADLPPLRLTVDAERFEFRHRGGEAREVLYPIEAERGYRARGLLWSPGTFLLPLEAGQQVTLTASTESWTTLRALRPARAHEFALARRRHLLAVAGGDALDAPAAELVLSADAFIVTPAGRVEDVARARAAGDEVRTVIAGYHWFTDWGRDTMISLEGLTLATGRHHEAAWILRTFAHHVRDGLIPNLFPEGESEGLYHTADATLWFFHAVARYVEVTGDRATLDALLPTLREIIAAHERGTRFGIQMDPADGLLRQGAEGYQLTWMDAKVDGWVVTPRRGKAVEINALWYQALRLLAEWTDDAARHAQADRVRASFNERFWNPQTGFLFDVVDGEHGPDAACRPNQIFSVALPHAVLDEGRWAAVVDVVERELLTPAGLRSLSRDHADYKSRYYGDLRARDAAYHQGTVWAWLIGPFFDAWRKVHPDRAGEARRFLEPLVAHLDEAGVNSISEIFDADAPFTPRGCIAQAWSVAEVLRCWRALDPAAAEP